MSRIYGAFCDGGQNYKNLVGFIKGLSKETHFLTYSIIEPYCWKVTLSVAPHGLCIFSPCAEINFDQKTVFGCKKDF